MPRGSKPGERRGGRKAGTPNKRTQVMREIADKALSDGVTPLEVMLTTMRDLWKDAVPQVEGARPNMAKAMQAVMIAEKAAPYVHPKLSSVDANVKGEISTLSDEQVDARLAELLAKVAVTTKKR